MARGLLVNESIQDGATLLRKLDAEDFPVEKMFRVNLPESDIWKLVIGTDFASQLGGFESYKKLGAILRSMGFGAFDLDDISILEPTSRQLADLLSIARHSPRLANGPEWVILEEAIVYRWYGDKLVVEVEPDLSAEKLTEVWKYELTLTNQPMLLFFVKENRVTIRFHPQHGPLGGIDEIYQPFCIAVHRRHPGYRIKRAV